MVTTDAECSVRVLLVEDDPMIARTLCIGLRYKGFESTVAPTLLDALEQMGRHTFDLVLVDIGLPDGSGLDFSRQLRQANDTLPILIITARTDEKTAVEGIESGADDFIRKPYGLDELAARMNRLLRRGGSAGGVLSFGGIRLDIQRRSAQAGAAALRLGKREFDILALLLRSAGKVVTREEILSSSNRRDEIYDRTIDSHLSHLRRKLSDAGANVQIVAVYGVGYRLMSI